MDLTVQASVVINHDGHNIDYTFTLNAEDLNGYSPDITDDLTRRALAGVTALIAETSTTTEEAA